MVSGAGSAIKIVTGLVVASVVAAAVFFMLASNNNNNNNSGPNNRVSFTPLTYDELVSSLDADHNENINSLMIDLSEIDDSINDKTITIPNTFEIVNFISSKEKVLYVNLILNSKRVILENVNIDSTGRYAAAITLNEDAIIELRGENVVKGSSGMSSFGYGFPGGMGHPAIKGKIITITGSGNLTAVSGAGGSGGNGSMGYSNYFGGAGGNGGNGGSGGSAGFVIVCSELRSDRYTGMLELKMNRGGMGGFGGLGGYGTPSDLSGFSGLPGGTPDHVQGLVSFDVTKIRYTSI